MQDGFSLRGSTVGIVGLGLMGGSLAMRLKGQCARLIGFDAHPPTLELALSKGIIDAAGGGLPHSQLSSLKEGGIDLLILATPVSVIIELLQHLPSIIFDPCIVMDVGSTKVDILDAMSSLPVRFDPIGGHPICGRENIGLENADGGLYENAPFVITPLNRTTQRARSAVGQIVAALGADLVELSAEEHDRILATTSHLPFLIASALALATPQEFAYLTGPGFRSTTRLAGTPSRMMMGILKTNRRNVLDGLSAFNDSLTRIAAALENEDDPELETVLTECRNSRLALAPPIGHTVGG
jgi:prephenate dehydrogenase